MVSILPTAVFIHVPKNGGTAASAALRGVDQYWPMHVPWRTVRDHVGGKPGFGFVRNPWARMHSLYYFLCYSPPRHMQRVNTPEVKAMGFKRWLLEGENWMSNEPVDGMISIRQNGLRYLPVGSANTYRGIENLDHPTLGMPPQQRRPSMWWLDGLPAENIGKAETLDVDLHRFAIKFGFPLKPVRRVNRTGGKPADYRPEYDAEMIAHIEKYHAPDIAFGQYAFE